MVQSINDLREGDVMNGIMYRRIFQSNNSFLQVTVGTTGSGKSLKDIREAELWYKNKLHRQFPIENICFSPEQVLNRLNSNQLQKGDILILEEAGTSMGSLDFATSVSKIFNYVLQSFRSLQIILFLNLPYFSMLNKNTRMLTHMYHQTLSIDHRNKRCIIKPFFLQTDQKTGKVYNHYPKILVDRSWSEIQRISYSLPSDDVRIPYEAKKKQFLDGLIAGSLVSLENKDKKRLTLFQMMIYGCWKRGITKGIDIAKEIQSTPQKVGQNMKYMRSKGYMIEESLGKSQIIGSKPK